MKKAYTLRVGDHVFVFSSIKAATAAYEILEAAEFHGRMEYRNGDKLVEFTKGLETKTVYREELPMMTCEEYDRYSAIEAYKEAINSTYYEGDKKQKQIDRRYKELLDLGIDPETIVIEEEDD